MNQKFTFVIYLLLIFLFKNISGQTLIFEDDMNGDNSIASLQSRGWFIVDNDGGGTMPAWFQGNPSDAFNALEGPSDGYVASNFQGSNGSGLVDQWLITPLLSVSSGDTLVFWARSAPSSGFNDSIFVFYSGTGSTNLSTYQFVFKAKLDITGWQPYIVAFGSKADIRIAIRYFVVDAPNKANFIGLDLFQLYTHTLDYPSNITLNKIYQFNDAAQSSSYRMIGLPGAQNTKISDMITGERKKDWNAFYDNGAASDFLKEFDNTSTFNFSPGKGFWVLSRNPITADATVPNVTLAADNTFSIQLHSGFNIISNPFENNVAWADVQNLNGTTDKLFDWTGVWNPNTAAMEPYKGYYFKNTNNLTSLKIPYSFPIGKLSKSASEKKLYSGTFIKLSLIQNKSEKSYAVAGINSSAKMDYDNFDCFAPPDYFDDLRIHFEENNLSDSYKFLFVDYRPEIGDGQSFDVKIKNSMQKSVRLHADGLQNFANYEIYLFDENLKKSYNLKENNDISISPIHEKQSFRLLIGNEAFINNFSKSSIPIEYGLNQNYPNPFNPSTIIKYQIPEDGLVELKIYNLLGKEVKTLVNENQEAGIHEAEFNASDFSSGVYLYVLKSGSFSAAKKMILIK